MHHDTGLVVTLAMGFVLAFALGLLAARLRLPPLVGYLAAGIAVGPFTPGVVADSGLAGQLAEVGVILLMFGVGLHFSIDDLKAVRGIAVPGAVVQIVLATAIGVGLGHAWGWTFGAGLVFGLTLSVASTVVLLKALDERNLVEGPNGRIAVGWLIVEDMAMVFALVLLPAVSGLLGGTAPDGSAGTGAGAIVLALVLTLAKVAGFVVLTLLVGPRILPPLLRQVARVGSRELFTLAVLASALGIALLAAFAFGVSFALGAFCAGMVLAKSEFSHRAATESLPLQDAFAVLFFVSVGMLFDPSVLIRQPFAVLLTVLLIVVGKGLISAAIVLALGYPIRTATLVGAGLAQIGEFSFILIGLGISLSLTPPEARDLVLAGAILSIILNPVLFALRGRLDGWALASPLGAGEGRRVTRFEALEMSLRLRKEKAEAHAPATVSLQSDDVLERFPIFASLPPPGRQELAGLFKPSSAGPGERLIRRGETADEMFFISSGSVEVALGHANITLKAGDFFGEMGVLSGRPRSADVTAIDYCQLFTLSRADLLAFMNSHPEFRTILSGVIEQRAEMNRSAPDLDAAPA